MHSCSFKVDGEQQLLKYLHLTTQGSLVRVLVASSSVCAYLCYTCQRLPAGANGDQDKTIFSDLQTLAWQVATIKEVFELFDTDGQHQLDEEELACAIYTLGFSQNGHVQVECQYLKGYILNHPHCRPALTIILQARIDV